MTSLSVIGCALAVVLFCAMHITARVIDYRRERDAADELNQLRKELSDEILNGGNAARIAVLRARLLDLEERRDDLNRR